MRLYKNLTRYLLAGTAALSLTSCLEESFPTSSVTTEQLQYADKSGLSSAVAAYMTTWDYDYYYDIGFAAFNIWRDSMVGDMPIYDATWDYYSYFCTQTYLGNYQLQTTFWQRYYYLIKKANIVLDVADRQEDSVEAGYAGNALAYRAMAYLDLMRMYEYRLTGVARLDDIARSRGILGLTVPIVTEVTTEEESRNNPRVPLATMNRFIMNDLNEAEHLLANIHSTAKNEACLGVVYGLKARLWLEMGSRFANDADALSQQIAAETDDELAAYDKLQIASARDCFAKAAEYARKAISEGFTPTSYDQWYSISNGFNTPISSWMWCIIISPDDTAASSSTWQSWVSFVCPEATWGIATPEYSYGRQIDARLFSTVETGDWRRATWIDPYDAGSQSAYDKTYGSKTSLTYSEWSKYPGYVSFKFRPAGGERITSAVGNAVSIPLMRIEEMYLIEAEAKAWSEGVGAGKAALESFLNSYRYNDGSYTCNAAAIEEFTDEVFRQRRIELWGEGLLYFDYRRLVKPCITGYPGTNHPVSYRYNSYEGYVAPWTNFYIPDSEQNFNADVILNPDPSMAIPTLWKE
ncbi:MAG: RagB/SusD family nutrient uptake outer membrane protein [Paramuribaculum sp.]|nr:RagB/SusD family nutrient uptake outer membrane protein [Paramuribaculum sp.]